jgi:plasmid stabilization system protein ParE
VPFARGAGIADVEDAKSRLGGDFLRTRAVDSGAYVRDVRKYIANASLKEPPEAARIAKLYFSQRDGAIAELGGAPRMLFALFAIAAESVYQEKPELFGGIDDIDGHKVKVAQLAARSRAREDIKQIATYIGEHNAQASMAFRQTLQHIYEVLLDLPEMGSVRNFRNPEMKGLRMLPVPNLRTIFSSTARQ